MFRPLPHATASLACALLASAPLAAQAGGVAPAQAQSALTGSALLALAALLALVALHRPLLANLRRNWPHLAARLGRYLPDLPERPRHVPRFATNLPESDSAALIASAKQRMTLVHHNLRQTAPELLPPLAEYRAVQNRLLAAIAKAEGEAEAAQELVISGLAQIEAATSKLSVVLPDTTKEYAFGNYADTLERLSGEAMDCLCGLRNAKRVAPPEVQNGDQVA